VTGPREEPVVARAPRRDCAPRSGCSPYLTRGPPVLQVPLTIAGELFADSGCEALRMIQPPPCYRQRARRLGQGMAQAKLQHTEH